MDRLQAERMPLLRLELHLHPIQRHGMLLLLQVEGSVISLAPLLLNHGLLLLAPASNPLPNGVKTELELGVPRNKS